MGRPVQCCCWPTDDSDLGWGWDVLVISESVFCDEGDEGGGEAEAEADAELWYVEAAYGDTLKTKKIIEIRAPYDEPCGIFSASFN